MIAIKKQYKIFLFLITVLALSGCNDKWDDHNKILDPSLTENLLSVIRSNSDLSTFAGYLAETGYDEVIASSKTFTVWAPTNTALESLDGSIVSDDSLLKQFIANHISNQAYLTRSANPLLTIRTLNGKNVLFTKTTFEEANLTEADRLTSNGVLHIVDMAIPPKKNAWEFLENSATSQQRTFLLSQNWIDRDLAKAVITGIDPNTGENIYEEGTGYFERNRFLDTIADLSDEDNRYTFIVLTDDGLNTEKARLAPYFTVNIATNTPERNAALTDSITTWNLLKDMVLLGDYTPEALPDTLFSPDSVKMHIDPAAIVETHRVSNGVVYVMSSLNYRMKDKLKPVIIQGENYVPYTGVVPNVSYRNTSGTRSTRDRRNPITMETFREIYFSGHSTSEYWVHYLPTVNSIKYKVYWVAVRDFNTTGTVTLFSQRVTFKTPTPATLPYTQVPLFNYNEVYLGEYTVTAYGPIDAFLVSFNSTNNTLNSLVLDYIKMVPVTE